MQLGPLFIRLQRGLACGPVGEGLGLLPEDKADSANFQCLLTVWCPPGTRI
jgi:hypothetical protein